MSIQTSTSSSPQKLTAAITPTTKSPVLTNALIANQLDRTEESTPPNGEVASTTEVIELLSVVSGQLTSIAKHRRAKEVRAVAAGGESSKVPSLIEECDGEDSDYDEDEDLALEARIMDDIDDDAGSDQGRDGSIEKRRSEPWDPSKSDLGIEI
jgi:hypothetical protein